MIAFVSTPRFIEHDAGPHHPECPDRLRVIDRALRQTGLLNGVDPFPEFSHELGSLPSFHHKLLHINPEPADRKWVSLVHRASYIERIESVCNAGGGIVDLGDTPVCPASLDIALLALGGVLQACDAVLTGQARRAFAAIRPPGHHAEPDRPMGFCLFSNIAIAARYIQQQYGVERVAIIDFDVHHGNGTQAAFEADSSVFFCSIHQHPRTCYPGTGFAWEIGTGRGRGYTLNLPMDPGCGDMEYLRVIESRLVPELDEFMPEVMLLSAGFDAHAEDPLADMKVSEEGFELITRTLAAVADRHCQGRVISLLEGGYNLRALGRSVVRHLVGLGAR